MVMVTELRQWSPDSLTVVWRSMKSGFIVKKKKVCSIWLCVCLRAEGCMEGMVWIEPDKCEFILHVEGQAQYVDGVLLDKVITHPTVQVKSKPM